MKKKNKTTAQKLKSCKSYEGQEKLLNEWKENWYQDQRKTVYLIRQAAMKNDHNTIMHMIDILQGMTEKRFGTLENIIKIINNRDYELKRINELDDKDESSDDEFDDEIEDIINKNDIEEMSKFYKGGMSTKKLALDYNISEEKVIKLLVTSGVFTSDIYDKIKELRQKGKTDDAIREELGFSKKSFHRYVPYTRGIYGLKESNLAAIYQMKWRNGLTKD